MISFTNLDKIPLKVRMDSKLGSNDRLKIKLINVDGSHRSVKLMYSDPKKFLIGSCTDMTPLPRAITLLDINYQCLGFHQDIRWDEVHTKRRKSS